MTSGPDVSRTLAMARDATRQLSEVSRIATQNSSAVTLGAPGLSRFPDSFAHGAVLNIGRFMGHSFRPWEAVKMARGIGTAGAVLSVAAIGISMYLQIREYREEARRAEETARARQDLRAHFEGIARTVAEVAAGRRQGG